MRIWLCVCVVIPWLMAAPARAQLIINGGFETGSPNLGPRPTTFGEWRGDRTLYVGSTSGIAPFAGARMLQFVNGEFVPSSSDGSQYWQNVDLSAFAADIALGQAYLAASTRFNRIAGDAQTDTEFNLVVRARSGNPTSFNDLGGSSFQLISDADVATWELASVNGFQLPIGTTHLQVEINAVENVFNDTINPEFDGHFADAVTLNITVVPEPSALILTGCAGCGVIVRRFRSRR